MHINNLEQLTNFIYFIITGMVLGIVFDIFRILRKSFKTSDLVTNIEDILFGIITGIVLLFTIFLFNSGELRLYLFLGIIFGIILYLLLISKYFIKINVEIIKIIKKFIILITKPFIILQKFIKKIFFKPISFICINLKLLFKKILKKFSKNIKIPKKSVNEEGF